MTIMRGWTRLKKHGPGGNILPISRNLRLQAEFATGSPVGYQVIRVKGTTRRPHVLFHRPDRYPKISPLEVIMLQGLTLLGEDGALALPDAVVEEVGLGEEDLVELKTLGPNDFQWLIAYNRGPRFVRTQPTKFRRQTTKEEETKQWHRMPLKY